MDTSTTCVSMARAVRSALARGRSSHDAVGLVTVGLLAIATQSVSQALFPPEVSLENLLPANGGDGSDGLVLTPVSGARAASVASAGDFNGDGFSDVALGAYGEEQGAAYVVFGPTGPIPGELRLEELLVSQGGDGTRGFVLSSSEEGARLGYDVSGGGDINGDGISDIVIGAPGSSVGNYLTARGRAYVVFGSTDAFPAEFALDGLLPEEGGDGSKGFVVSGLNDLDEVGFSLDLSGDVNGDGIADLFIGSRSSERYGRSGRAFVVFGRDDGFAAELNRTTSVGPEFSFGGRGPISAGTDWNGDGIDDMLIASQTFLSSRYGEIGGGGEAYVVFGAPQLPELIKLDLDIPAGAVAGTILDAGRRGGRSIAGVGDLNGDGIDDVVVATDWGAELVFGGAGPRPTEASAADLPGTSLSGFPGYAGGARYSYASAGDINGDGIDDLIVDASGTPEDGNPDLAAYVLFGSANLPDTFSMGSLLEARGGDGVAGFVLRPEFRGVSNTSGRDVDFALAGDLDADGQSDLAVADTLVGASGRFYLLYAKDNADLPPLPPQFTSEPNLMARVGEPYRYTAHAEDPNEADVVTITPLSIPAWLMSTDSGDGFIILEGTPALADVGVFTVVLQAADSGSPTMSVEQSFALAVLDNSPPKFTSTPGTAAIEGLVYRYVVTFEDPDEGDALSVMIVDAPAWLRLEDAQAESVSLTGTPGEDDIGMAAVVLSLSDDSDTPLTAEQSFMISTTANEAPMFTSQPTLQATAGMEYLYSISVSDPEGDEPIEISAPVRPPWLRLVDNDDLTATLSGTPSASDIGDSLVVLDARQLAPVEKTGQQGFTLTVVAAAPPPPPPPPPPPQRSGGGTPGPWTLLALLAGALRSVRTRLRL